MKKNYFYITFVLLIVAMFIAGCASQTPQKSTPSPTQPKTTNTQTNTGVNIETKPAYDPNAPVTLRFNGAKTAAAVVTELAKSYSVLHPNVKIEVVVTGSTDAVMSLANKTADIGLGSRPLFEEEITAGKKGGIDAYQTTIFYDTQMMYVSSKNPINDISLEQVKRMFFDVSNPITDWGEITNGTFKGPIHAWATTEGVSGSAVAFKEVVWLQGMFSKKINTTAKSYTTILRKDVVNDPYVISYTTVGYLADSYLTANNVTPGTFKSIKFDGYAGTNENIRNGLYKMSRVSTVITNGPPTGAAKDFVLYILGPEGKKEIEKQQFTPVN